MSRANPIPETVAGTASERGFVRSPVTPRADVIRKDGKVKRLVVTFLYNEARREACW